MSLFKNGIDLSTGLDAFIAESNELFIFTPYVKLSTLRTILDKYTCCKVLVVRWQLKDLLLGSSDLEVYEYCRSRGIALYFNQRLHLKAYVDNFQRCMLGSANISSRGLDIPSSDRYNYELATIVDNLDEKDHLYFRSILAESTLITHMVYEQIKEMVNSHEDLKVPNDYFNIHNKEKDFLISALPMAYTPKRLIDAYITGQYLNLEEQDCILHDMAIYSLPFGLPAKDLSSCLRKAFFAHSFVQAFLQMINYKGGEVYFGEAKAWIQENCTNVPVPRKWELTANTQILFRWIVDLGDGAYSIDRPNYSERLFVVVDH